MGLLQKLRQALPWNRFKPSPERLLAYEVDLAILTDMLRSTSVGDVDLDARALADMKQEDMKRIVSEETTGQVMHMFQVLRNAATHAELAEMSEDETSEDPENVLRARMQRTSSPGSPDEGSLKPVEVLADRRPELEAMSSLERQLDFMENFIRDDYGTFPRIAPSRVAHPAAGDGVFLEGGVGRGTVVAMYPGMVYLPYQVNDIIDNFHRQRASPDEGALDRHVELFGTPEEPNQHAVQRFDGVTINARAGSVAIKPNAFAVGHKVNHPPKGYLPNVMVCPFEFMEDDINRFERAGTGIKDFVPNRYFKDPAVTPRWYDFLMDKGIYMHALLYVTTRDVHDGEELFVNYRFNPSLDPSLFPEWYYPVDEEEDRMRWA